MLENKFAHMKVSYDVVKNREKEGVIISYQTHGTRLVTVVDGTEDLAECDAVLTRNKDLVLGVLTADCLPICIADKEKVAVLHAGWRGLCAGIVEVVMKEFKDSVPEVWVGPHIQRFEIKKDHCYKVISETFGETFLTTEDKKIIFEFSQAVASILPANTMWDNRNTYEDKTLPSYRRNHTKDRIVTMVQRT